MEYTGSIGLSGSAMEKAAREQNRVGKFCNICDNYTGKGTLGCRGRLGVENQKRVLARGWCGFGMIDGSEMHLITIGYVETTERIKYSRSDESALKEALGSINRTLLDKLEMKFK